MHINPKTKKILIIILVALLGLLLIVLFMKDTALITNKESLFIKKTENKNTSTSSSVYLVKTSPANNTSGTLSFLQFTFSEPVTADMFKVSVNPTIAVETSVRDQDPKTLLVSPVAMWKEGTTYTISISDAGKNLLKDSIEFTYTHSVVEIFKDSLPRPL